MQLVLDLLKEIFVALSGIYTKQETDAQLAVKADKAEVEAEATARQEADEALDERVTAVEPAKDSDWKDYMLARAKLTGVQANIELVKKAIVDSVALGDSSMLPARFIEDWKNLYGYESFSGRKLDAEFWSAYFEAVVGWMANPTATEEWVVTNNGDGTYSANYPYFSEAPTKPIVNFAVVSAKGIDSYPPVFNKECDVDLYLPNLTTASQFLSRKTYNRNFILPKFTTGYQFASIGVFGDVVVYMQSAKTLTNGFFSASANKIYAYTPNIYGVVRLFKGAKINEFVGCFPALADGGGAFNSSKIKRFSAPLPLLKTNKYQTEGMFASSLLEYFDSSLPSLTDGEDMFLNAKLPSAEISKILDSLPSWDSSAGGTGVITFTGCPGAAELTQSSPSVAAATARGWTVEL